VAKERKTIAIVNIVEMGKIKGLGNVSSKTFTRSAHPTLKYLSQNKATLV
jgi:hypothetical protein